LVDRDYHLKIMNVGAKAFDFFTLRYSVGQPMGALSSWGMLALTHHLLVQIAYREVYPSTEAIWYEDYELLGDDIVLFDKLVADSYLKLMLSIGVDINLSKSVLSTNGSFEFAKVTSYKGHTVSAVS
jgi:hypothetical protein